jgi:hypothetical protein
MLLNISYNQPKIREKINDVVGAPFNLVQRFRLNGTGSPKLHITNMSIDIHNLMVIDRNANICNIEMRPKGIIVMFRSLLETYALVIPYYKLNLYKGKAEEYSIYRDHYFIKVKADKPGIHNYMKKVLAYKSDNSPTQVEDML